MGFRKAMVLYVQGPPVVHAKIEGQRARLGPKATPPEPADAMMTARPAVIATLIYVPADLDAMAEV